jgi:hypothetical protein
MKRPDLLILVAVWEFLSAFGALICTGFITAAYFINASWFMGGMGYHMWENAWGGWPSLGPFEILFMGIMLLIAVGFLVISLLGGIGLLKGREWGRILSIIQAALSLFWVPVGTAIGILILIYLVRDNVRAYFAGGTESAPPAE